MLKQKKGMSTSLAAAVAVAFVALPHVSILADTNTNETVICPGVNACKGQGACGTWSNRCGHFDGGPGTNACKGQGFLMLSKAECVKRGSRGIKYVNPADDPALEK